jgi:uroporphyrin-III C-methyltransferase
VGHGSRRAEANDDVRKVARLIGERGGFSLIEAAFLEIEQPNIAKGFRLLVQRGAQHIIVHPYFLSPGRHTRGDLPREVETVAKEFPQVSYRITEPLSAHALVVEASIERVRETIEATEHYRAPDVNRYLADHGVVYLVGAGPGDPGLLTVKARDLLTTCDLVIYDYLVNPELLSLVPKKAERIYVGKVGGGRQTPQDQINYLLVQQAKMGKRVVRLKGGDPFLFGRGGEEAAALHDAGIRFEIVPGISSALAVPAYAGIPLTHRGVSSSVAVVTGARRETGEFSSAFTDLSAETIVVLMGISHLREIVHELVISGRSVDTPAAVIRWGTYDGQRTITGTLNTIVDETEREGIKAPAVIVIGEVVHLREQLQWFEQEAGNAGKEMSLALMG